VANEAQVKTSRYRAGVQTIGDGQIGLAGASVTATLLGAPGVRVFLTDITISGDLVANAVSGVATITGLDEPWNLVFVETVSAGGMFNHHYDPPLRASVDGGNVVANVPAIVNGGIVAINLHGYRG